MYLKRHLKMKNKTVYLKDYQKPLFEVTNLSLQVDLYDDHALVRSDLALKRQHPGALILHGDDLELVSLAMNAQQLGTKEYSLQD